LSKNCISLHGNFESCKFISGIDGQNGFSNEYEECKASTTLRQTNDTFDQKLVETNFSQDLSQLNQTECRYLLSALNTDLDIANLGSQEQKIIFKMGKKNMKMFSLLNTEDMNTQKFIELHLDTIALQLESSQIHSGHSKRQINENMDLDDFISITLHKNQNNTNSSISKNTNKLEDHNNTFSSSDLSSFDYLQDPKLPNTIQDLSLLDKNKKSELSNQDQDLEIIAFKAMCDELMLKSISVIDNDNVKVKNKIGFKYVNKNVLSCVPYTKYVPSKIHADTYSICFNESIDYSKLLSRKRHKVNNITSNLFDLGSPKFLNE